jgi:hypothetical protein
MAETKLNNSRFATSLHQHATICGAAEEAESAARKELEVSRFATSLHHHAAICRAAEEAESAARKELEANTLTSGDDEVKGTGKPSIVINETKYEDESSDSDSGSSSNDEDKTNLLPSNGKHTISF